MSYGAAEFSRDLDLALLAEPDDLDLLEAVLAELDAEVIAVPPFELEHLAAGLAVHFRCRQCEVAGVGALDRALREEEDAKRRRDVAYWKSLRERLERLRQRAQEGG